METKKGTLEDCLKSNTQELEKVIKKLYISANRAKIKLLVSKYSEIYKKEYNKINERKLNGKTKSFDLILCDLPKLLTNIAVIFNGDVLMAETLADNANSIKDYKDVRNYLWLAYEISMKNVRYKKYKQLEEDSDKYKSFLKNIICSPKRILKGKGKIKILEKSLSHGITLDRRLLSKYLG